MNMTNMKELREISPERRRRRIHHARLGLLRKRTSQPVQAVCLGIFLDAVKATGFSCWSEPMSREHPLAPMQGRGRKVVMMKDLAQNGEKQKESEK